MDDTVAKLLGLPLGAHSIPLVSGREEVAYFNAALPSSWGQTVGDNLICFQPERKGFLTLQSAQYRVFPEVEGSGFGGSLIATNKHKRLSQFNLSHAWSRTKSGGAIVIAGLKKEGIASLKKLVSNHIPLLGQVAKYHGLVFWFNKTDADIVWEDKAFQSPVGYETGPGMFSAEKVDKGSRLLVEHYPDELKGNVADIGAGWGFLSHQLLKKYSTIRQLDLYESNWDSLQAARFNLAAHLGKSRTDYYWRDICSESPHRKYDWVIMNPPFHSGRKSEPELGRQFIETAHKALVQRGTLLMVANQKLPYEQLLESLFTSFECLSVQDGFKVLKANK